MTRHALRALAVVLTLGASACGGGGGDSTSISVSPRALEFSTEQGGGLPAAKTVHVSYKGDGVIVGYPTGTSDPGWLSIVQSGTGSPLDFHLSPNTSDLPFGTHRTTVRFVTGHLDGSDLKFTDLPVTYAVSAPFKASTTNLSFDQVQGNDVSPQYVSVTKDDPNFSVVSNQSWLHAVPQPESSGGQIEVSVEDLAPGAYEGTITISDTSDGHPPLQVHVSFSVRAPDLIADRNTLTFEAVSDQESLPAGFSVSLSSETAQQIGFTEATSYGPGASGWLQAFPGGTTPVTRLIRPSTTAIPAGNYEATLQISPANGRPAVDIEVSYAVRAAVLTASPSSLNFQIDAGTTGSSLARTLTLSDDGAPLTWTASSDVSWLVLNRSSGNTRTANAFTVSVSQSEISRLANGTHYGAITIRHRSASINERVETLPVSLSLMLPQVSEVIPAFGAVDSSLTHVLRGQGFASITSQKARVGDREIGIEVLSDDLARVTLPALPANTYQVSVDNQLGLARATGKFTSKNFTTFASASLARNHRSSRALYDPARQAVYSLDLEITDSFPSGIPAVRRYSNVSGSWQVETVINFADIFDMELSGDGGTLYLAIDDGIYTLDLTNPGANIIRIGTINGGGFYLVSKLTKLADGRMLVVTGLRGSGYVDLLVFDPEHGSFNRIGFVSCGMTGTSADRTQATVVQQCGASDIDIYDTATGVLRRAGNSTGGTSQNRIAVERAGRLYVVDDRVFDQNSNLLAALGDAIYGPAFSPDSSRIYGVYGDLSSGKNQALQAFDISSGPVAGRYPVIASYPIANAKDYAQYSSFTLISSDGRTAFVISASQFSVIPLSD